jgi:hypothetical protein
LRRKGKVKRENRKKITRKKREKWEKQKIGD